MSLSGLIEQDYLTKVSILQSILNEYQPQWVVAATEEERLVIEAEALDKFLEIVEEDIYYNEVSEFEHPDEVDFGPTYKQYELIQKSNSARVRTLLEMFLSRDNTQRLQLADLAAQVKRIKQKHAILDLWNDERVKFFTGDKFENMENLNTEFTSVEACEVHATQGVLTLPIQLRERVEVLGVKIGSKSNGIPGNSDQAVLLADQTVTSVLADDDLWFEYERLDAGPCKLTLTFELTKPQIINSVRVLPANISIPLSFKVQDIQFTTSARESIGVKDLLPSDIAEEVFDIPIASYTDGWELLILPIEAVSVSITFVQTQPYSILTTGIDGSEAYRDRYVIPIQYVEFNRLRYRQAGGINSGEISIRQNLYAIEPVMVVNPDNTSLYDLAVEISMDGGATWKQVGTEDNSTITAIDNSGSFLWRLTLARIEEAFQNFTSFFENEQPRGKIKTMLRSVSRFNSPTTVALNSRPADQQVYVIQPKIARRGDKTKNVRLGITGAGDNAMRLPLNLLRGGVRPESVRIYASGTELSAKRAGETLSGFEWSFSDDYEEILIPEDIGEGVIVYLSLDDEAMVFEERSDGYYHQMMFAFDPDKNNMEVALLTKEPSRGSTLLPRDQTVINLDHKNLFTDSFQLISSNGTVWTSRPNRSFVYDAADNDYYIDYENGILYLASVVGDDNLRASYNYQPLVILSRDDYDIVYEDYRPWGIKIKPNVFEPAIVEETISDALQPKVNILGGGYGVRNTFIANGSAARKQLSYEGIVRNTFHAPTDLFQNELLPEEVEYINGVSEFLGLTLMLDERTQAIEADGDGVAQFGLSARGLWYRDMGVSFGNVTVFAVERNNISQVVSGSAGDYYIDDEGIVYVQLGGAGFTLRAGILMSYYYKNPTFDPSNKYSVDYDLGVLYAHSSFNQDAVVSYKAASYKISYDIAKELTDFTYFSEQNAVEVNTEVLSPVNNQIKVIWSEDLTPTIDSTTSQYFSPLISFVGFRFS